MTREEINERNEAIAKFMNALPVVEGSNVSWDWLMPVVEKIERLGYTIEISGDSCEIYKMYSDSMNAEYMEAISTESKIEATFLAVSDFCKWYNNNPEQIKQ